MFGLQAETEIEILVLIQSGVERETDLLVSSIGLGWVGVLRATVGDGR